MIETSLADCARLNARREWFTDDARGEDCGPFVFVHDNFYPDPVAVRELALRQTFYQYSPPLAEQVGAAIAGQHVDKRPAWMSSALLRYWGQTVRHPQPGFRYAPPTIRQRLESLLDEHIDSATWTDGGDWWNGAFHLQFDSWHRNRAAIHHHYKDGDVTPRGWSGVVYLTPDAPADAGTSIWRDRSSGLCIAPNGASFDSDERHFELVLTIENRFNRLVLFRENVLHRLERGFGKSPDDARLVQTFFFRSESHAQAVPAESP
jgi:hypothetical protein